MDERRTLIRAAVIGAVLGTPATYSMYASGGPPAAATAATAIIAWYVLCVISVRAWRAYEEKDDEAAGLTFAGTIATALSAAVIAGELQKRLGDGTAATEWNILAAAGAIAVFSAANAVPAVQDWFDERRIRRDTAAADERAAATPRRDQIAGLAASIPPPADGTPLLVDHLEMVKWRPAQGAAGAETATDGGAEVQRKRPVKIRREGSKIIANDYDGTIHIIDAAERDDPKQRREGPLAQALYNEPETGDRGVKVFPSLPN